VVWREKRMGMCAWMTAEKQVLGAVSGGCAEGATGRAITVTGMAGRAMELMGMTVLGTTGMGMPQGC
jgi:xanthine/CO dehydrogenase XdhC/CoxF family maturation factor